MPDGSLSTHTLTLEKPSQSPLDSLAAPCTIAATALRIKAIVDRENFLDNKRVTRDLTREDENEEDCLFDERMALTEQLVQTAPESSADALIIVMHAVDRLNFAKSIVGGADLIDICERAIRSASVFLAQELGVDLTLFGSEIFLPIHLSQSPVGRA